ncbi:aldo/keto reductase [Ruegeria lacuscaerulensis]|uniref:aldo/keto reductase n=1 Tax=Ruegeria lacuscaerulensis TaxID=55218 RepID=UPI001479869A|nr:aldo/keto reductase [Ruegeria lacuscaerulensis]
MEMKPLGRTGIMVTDLCLGTMTFGTQTSEADAHIQMDMALEAGINFVDAAEMYPVNPISAETVGRTEEILGNWNAANPSRRSDYVLATKHSGAGFTHARNGSPISAQTIPEAVEGSLRRLKTDCIDLYQFHWPNRGSYMFRQNWTFAPAGDNTDEVLANMQECLEALQVQVNKGNIRAFGLSNESAWGTAQWLRLAEAGAGPRVASVQNEYSLLCRHFDTDMAELSVHEDVGLMAFSPLAAGFLTGKYQGGAVPDGSRMSINAEMGGRKSDRVFDAVAAYLDIADRHGLDPVQMSLAWCQTRKFMLSAIFGATTVKQLERILAGKDLELSSEVLSEITAAHRAFPMPY